MIITMIYHDNGRPVLSRGETIDSCCSEDLDLVTVLEVCHHHLNHRLDHHQHHLDIVNVPEVCHHPLLILFSISNHLANLLMGASH